MTAKDTAAILSYHRSMIAYYGNTGHAALGWRDQESQSLRFRILAGIADLTGNSILDAGCGHGDLYTYLQVLFPGIVYTGIEQIPELLEEAIRRHGNLPTVNFISGDFMNADLPLSDFVMASGSLNYYQSDPDFIYKVIDKLYGCCRIGLAFNLLRRVIPNEFITAYEPATILAYCKGICKRTELLDTYSEEDFTLFLYR
jgi:SAM-dependent methyltransferase